MKQKQYKSRKKKYITIFGIVCVLAVVLAWGLVRLSPRTYAPVAPQNPEQVSPYLTHRLGPDFYNQIQLNRPFELIIDQQGLNDIVSRGIWPQRFGQVTVSTPVFLFENNAIYLMSRIGYYGFSSVVTITARPKLDKQGRLTLNILSVRLGLLPITTLAARIAEQAVDDSAVEFKDLPELEPIVRAVITNTPFEPAFTFDKQRIRLDNFILEPGRLRVFLAPVNDAVYKY